MKELLVVVDMVNGFVNEGALADKKIDKITPNIEKLIVKAKQKGMHIVAFKDCHKMGDEEFKTFPPHCLKGTSESDLIPQLKKYEKDMVLINKNTTNGFITKEFKQIVNLVEYDRVYVTGCCTDICVIGFVESYLNYIKENNKKTQIVVFEDSCYTFNSQNHNAEEKHKESIVQMKNKGAKIVRINTRDNIRE